MNYSIFVIDLFLSLFYNPSIKNPDIAIVCFCFVLLVFFFTIDQMLHFVGISLVGNVKKNPYRNISNWFLRGFDVELYFVLRNDTCLCHNW